MNNGIYSSALGGIMAMRELEITANNLANIDTPGYKVDRCRTTASLNHISRQEFDKFRNQLKDIRDLLDVKTSYTQGSMRNTDNPLDLAIEGEGFFVVEGEDGDLYTRSGAFKLDTEGYLIASDGRRVMGEGGPIQITAGEFVVSSDGEVLADGQSVDRLLIVDFKENQDLTKKAGTYFEAPRGRERPAVEYSIVQGALESSNVNLMKTMIQLIQTQRSFNSYMKMIGTQNDLNSRAVQDLARIR